MDFAWFDQRFENGSVAAGLRSLARREAGGAALLASSLAVLPKDKTRGTLEGLAFDSFRHRLDFAGLARARGSLAAGSDATVAFLANARPAMSLSGNIVEVDFSDRRIPGRIGDNEISIIVDTGAPGVGISRAIVDREGYARIEGTASANIPSLDLRYRLDPTIIEEMRIGPATFRDIPAESGELTPKQQATLEQNGLASDMIVGLDFFAPFFDVVEFDQVEGKLRLYRDDPEPAAVPNFVMGAARYPLVQLEVGGVDRTVILDTGSGNNNLPSEWLSAAECKGYREFERSWGSFGEYLVSLDFGAAGGLADFWVSARDFGADDVFGARGVLGAVNRGRLRIDLEDANIAWRDYDLMLANYDFSPSRVVANECPGL